MVRWQQIMWGFSAAVILSVACVWTVASTVAPTTVAPANHIDSHLVPPVSASHTRTDTTTAATTNGFSQLIRVQTCVGADGSRNMSYPDSSGDYDWSCIPQLGQPPPQYGRLPQPGARHLLVVSHSRCEVETMECKRQRRGEPPSPPPPPAIDAVAGESMDTHLEGSDPPYTGAAPETEPDSPSADSASAYLEDPKFGVLSPKAFRGLFRGVNAMPPPTAWTLELKDARVRMVSAALV